MASKPETIEDMLNNLKKTSNAIQLDNIDPLWDIPNQFVNSIQMLLIILTKTSSIPFIPDFTEEPIYTDLGINLEQAKLIQESNNTLLQLHASIIKYCVQQYTIASYIKNMMDTIVLQIPETDMSGLIDFITNYKANKNIQKGGQLLTNKLIPMLFMIICLIQIVLPSKVEDTKSLQLTSSDNLAQFQKGMISSSLKNIAEQLFQTPEITSGPVNMNTLVIQYDKKTIDETSGLIGSVLSLFNTPEDGQAVLKKTVDDFNAESRNISSGVEEQCIDIMQIGYEHGVFTQLQDMDTLQETSDKLQAIGLAFIEKNNEFQSDIVSDVVGVITSAAVVPFTGDTVTPLAFLTDMGSVLWDVFQSGKTVTKQTKEVLNPPPSQLTETQKIELREKMFAYSKVYCSSGYNLQLNLDGTTINVIGDKIEYQQMINMINTLEANIAAQNTNLDLRGDDTQTQISINILDSLHQRLGVLKGITTSLEQIVNFSFKLKMTRFATYSSPTSMGEFQTFLTNQLTDLKKMLAKLKTQFPKREADLKLQKTQAEEDADLNMFEAETEAFQTAAAAAARQHDAEASARELGNWGIAVATIVQSWVDLGLNTSEFGRQNLGKTVKSIADLAGEPVKVLFNSLLEFVTNILKQLILSPAGLLAILGGLLYIQFAFGGVIGTIKIFKKGGEWFLAIIWGGIVFVYKLIKTPFGYIYKQIATIYVPNQNDALNPPPPLNPNGNNVLQIENRDPFMNRAAYDRIQEPGEDYDGDIDYVQIEIDRNRRGILGGGRRLKGGRRKTRKHKKKRTNKLNGRKRRQTKYRKGRRTKKR